MHIAIIGHITRDIMDNGYAIGGAVSYSGIAARRLGAEVTVLTRAHPDDVRILEDEGIQVFNLPTKIYTTFINRYHNGTRTQRLLSVAAPILASEIPPEIYEADALLLAPVAQEVDPAIALLAPKYLAATPQGWMRKWDSDGHVSAAPWRYAGRILPHLDSIIFSDLDLGGDPEILSQIIDTVPLAAITKAAQGCVIYHRGQRSHAPARPTHEIDATGAGDIFAAAFLVETLRGKEPATAAYFANVAASYSIEAVGHTGIPDRSQIEAYILSHPML